MPTTFAPSRASASDRSPPPQPRSSTRAPLSVTDSRTKSRRAGFRSCSAREGPFGSHQLVASFANFSSSAGLTFGVLMACIVGAPFRARQTPRSRPEGRCYSAASGQIGDLPLPAPRLLLEQGFVDVDEL